MPGRPRRAERAAPAPEADCTTAASTAPSRAPRAGAREPIDDQAARGPGGARVATPERLLRAIGEQGCGFVGSAVIGLSHLDDVRPHEQGIELWAGPVEPEVVRRDTPQWERHRLHNAANLYHVQQRLGLAPGEQRVYKVAWVGGCVLYDVARLRACGGFAFWRDLPPEHCGEDVLAQLRVMARFGGCGLIPSGVFHQELPTTVPDRRIDAPRVLDIAPA